MYDIAICDDDAVFSASFRAQLTRVLDARGVAHRITVFSDPDALQHAVAEGGRFALLFLDILFAETQRGIRLAAALQQAGCRADIIFMSSSPDFAAASFDVSPLHYLLKPVADEKLCAALDRFLDKNAPYLLRFDTSHGYLQVPLAEVTYFEIFIREIVIHKANGTKETCAGTLKELEQRLPHKHSCARTGAILSISTTSRRSSGIASGSPPGRRSPSAKSCTPGYSRPSSATRTGRP